jgi:type I restriction enzyme R subunit
VGRFIRSMLGLEAAAAKQAFGELLVGQTFNSAQIRFMDLLLNFFTSQGVLNPAQLFDSPFTDLNSSGLAGLFDQETSTRIIAIVEDINRKAEAA